MPIKFKDTPDAIFEDTADAVWDKDDVVYVYQTLPITITLSSSAPGGNITSSDLSTIRTGE